MTALRSPRPVPDGPRRAGRRRRRAACRPVPHGSAAARPATAACSPPFTWTTPPADSPPGMRRSTCPRRTSRTRARNCPSWSWCRGCPAPRSNGSPKVGRGRPSTLSRKTTAGWPHHRRRRRQWGGVQGHPLRGLPGHGGQGDDVPGRRRAGGRRKALRRRPGPRGNGGHVLPRGREGLRRHRPAEDPGNRALRRRRPRPHHRRARRRRRPRSRRPRPARCGRRGSRSRRRRCPRRGRPWAPPPKRAVSRIFSGSMAS